MLESELVTVTVFVTVLVEHAEFVAESVVESMSVFEEAAVEPLCFLFEGKCVDLFFAVAE